MSDAHRTQKRIGVFAKEEATGKAADEWKKVYNERKTKDGFEEIDVSTVFSSTWAAKDEEEQVGG